MLFTMMLLLLCETEGDPLGAGANAATVLWEGFLEEVAQHWVLGKGQHSGTGGDTGTLSVAGLDCGCSWLRAGSLG